MFTKDTVSAAQQLGHRRNRLTALGSCVAVGVALTMFGGASAPASGAVIVANYDFGTSTPLDSTSKDTDPSTASDLQYTNLSQGSSAFGNPPRALFFGVDDFRRTSESDAFTHATPEYISFTITPAPGQPLWFTSLSLDLQRNSTTAATNFFVRADADPAVGVGDDFATTVGAGVIDVTPSTSAPGIWKTYTIDLSDDAFLQNVTKATTFRVYFWGNTGTTLDPAHSLRLDNLIVEAALIPEPASLMLLAAGTLLIGLRRRRKNVE
jgi:hypothetical protein